MENNNFEVPNPLSDSEKEMLFGVKIEHLSKEQILKKFGHRLISEQKDIDPEIAKVLTNDFFNKLWADESKS